MFPITWLTALASVGIITILIPMGWGISRLCSKSPQLPSCVTNVFNGASPAPTHSIQAWAPTLVVQPLVSTSGVVVSQPIRYPDFLPAPTPMLIYAAINHGVTVRPGLVQPDLSAHRAGKMSIYNTPSLGSHASLRVHKEGVTPHPQTRILGK